MVKYQNVHAMFVGSQKSELRTHKMAGQQQDCNHESTWFYMKPLYITRAQFIQNIMTSQYYNTSPWRFVKNSCNSLIALAVASALVVFMGPITSGHSVSEHIVVGLEGGKIYVYALPWSCRP